VQALLIGVWATLAPHSWYASFPGGGRHWVSVDGPYNHHLVGDVGALYLGLAVLTIAALGGRSRAMTRTAGVAWVVSGLPHLLYHVGHHSMLATSDAVASLGGLAFAVVLGVVCVVGAPVVHVPTRSSRSSPVLVAAS
jgi:hypothetical protein